jgi:hypothetical protein
MLRECKALPLRIEHQRARSLSQRAAATSTISDRPVAAAVIEGNQFEIAGDNM